MVRLNVARERALEYRLLAKQGLNPKYHKDQEVPCFEEVVRQVHIDRLPIWENPKHGQQWINTLADYAFPKIGRMPVSDIGQPEILQVLSPIWTEKHETARRVAQLIRLSARSCGPLTGGSFGKAAIVARKADDLPRATLILRGGRRLLAPATMFIGIAACMNDRAGWLGQGMAHRKRPWGAKR
ncbi:phage integrase central domain-containing protein [Paracoccus saliphilus]|uniref:phage integrase central domain-containing protein n=1 Tax=Paracoccus saliphilus TaxID=405559 RepID=UPI003AF329C4